MKKLIATCMCVLAMIFLCPVSVMAETEVGILVLPEDDGTGYPVRGISSGYNYNEEVYKVVIPENILRLGDEVFLGNTNLSEIQLHSKLQMIGANAFTETAYYDNSENWDEDGVLYIGDCLIDVNQEKIGDSYEIRPGTRLIASRAFADCEKLNEIIIPDSIEYVGADAFLNTGFYNNLDNWNQGILTLDYLLLKVSEDYTGVLEVQEGIRTIADEAAVFCELTEVITPESLVHIGIRAFSSCVNLKKISLEKNVETLGRGPLYRCFALEEIVVDEENEHFEVVEGLLLNEELSSVVKCPQQVEGSVVIPSCVEIINAFAFENCKMLDEVVMPENCIFIGQNAFYGCEELSDITIPETMEYIDHYAFHGCENLSEIVIPDNVTYLGKNVFSNCKELEAAVIGAGVAVLRENLFSGCDNLIYVELGDGITEIAYTAFEDTKYICNVRGYKDGLLVISDKYLMKVAPDVVECEIPDGVEIIADGAFEYVIEREELEKIYIPKSLKDYNWFAFQDLSDDVKIYYDGTAEKFEDIAGYGWEQVNLITKDLRRMVYWGVGGFGVLCLASVTMIVSSKRAKEEELEDDYEEE